MTIQELKEHCEKQCNKCETLYSKCSKNEHDKEVLLAHDKIYQEHRLTLKLANFAIEHAKDYAVDDFKSYLDSKKEASN